MNRKQRREAGERKKDHGSFKIGPPSNEIEMFESLVDRARRNTVKPGYAGGRIEAILDLGGGKRTVGHRTYSIRLDQGVVELTEDWDGRETARRTIPIDQFRAWARKQAPPPSPTGSPSASVPPPTPKIPKKAMANASDPAVPVRPIRRGLEGLSPLDVDAVQRHLVEGAEREIVTTGAVALRLVLVCDDHIEELRVDRAWVVDPAGDPRATFDAIAGRADVQHRVVIGELNVADDGAHVAFVAGVVHGDEAQAWVGRRRFRVLPGRIGSQPAEWEISSVESGELPDDVAAALAHTGRPFALLPAALVPPPETLASFETLGPTSPTPETAEQVSEAAAAFSEGTALGLGPDELYIFVFRGREVERWLIEGEIPWGLDDLVRAIAARAGNPHGAATVQLGLVPDEDGSPLRAVITTAEANGQRYRRLLALKWADGSPMDAGPTWTRVAGSGPNAIAQGEGWIGVPPISPIGMTPLGAIAEA